MPNWRREPVRTRGPIMPTFKRLNLAWNAEPNGPEPIVRRDGSDVVLQFSLNAHRFEQFEEEDVGILRFHGCARYRLGPTNDEGWYLGQCRYSGSAPAWGEFYELVGEDPLRDRPTDWVMIDPASTSSRHFLFYLRDNTFECIAADWSFDPTPANALHRASGSGPAGPENQRSC